MMKTLYEYLPDGSKLSALAGSGAGYKYRGSFVYSVDASGNEKLERGGLRVLSLCQNWIPGRNKGKPVNVLSRYSIKL